MKTMNDVNEMRLEAAAACGEASRRMAEYMKAEDMHALFYGIAMREAGQYAQYARDLEAWVTLRERVTALLHYLRSDDASRSVTAAVMTVLDYMDELEAE